MITPGSRFGKLVVVGKGEFLISGGIKRSRLECLCDCGRTTHVEAFSLRNGGTSTCGCSKRKLSIKVGDKFTRLTVTFVPPYGLGSRGNLSKVDCLCECGNTATLAPAALVSGKTQSCGCLKLKRDGDSASAEFGIWYRMIARCYDQDSKDYPDYGGRGIAVCDRWRESYPNFLFDMGRRPSKELSIDRIEVNGNYEKSNCRWATDEQQANNRRTSHYVEFNGDKRTIAEWAFALGFKYACLMARIQNGWSVQDTLTIPSGAKKR